MAHQVETTTGPLEFIGLTRDPDSISFVPCGRGTPGWRAKVLHVPVYDEALVNLAATLRRGDQVEVAISTDWGAPGLPTWVEAMHPVETGIQTSEPLAELSAA
jgi:hypothetical protein